MSEPIPIGEATEGQCAVCARWPQTLRATMRSANYVLPLKEPICKECVMAFWANITAKATSQRPS